MFSNNFGYSRFGYRVCVIGNLNGKVRDKVREDIFGAVRCDSFIRVERKNSKSEQWNE